MSNMCLECSAWQILAFTRMFPESTAQVIPHKARLLLLFGPVNAAKTNEFTSKNTVLPSRTKEIQHLMNYKRREVQLLTEKPDPGVGDVRADTCTDVCSFPHIPAVHAALAIVLNCIQPRMSNIDPELGGSPAWNPGPTPGDRQLQENQDGHVEPPNRPGGPLEGQSAEQPLQHGTAYQSFRPPFPIHGNIFSINQHIAHGSISAGQLIPSGLPAAMGAVPLQIFPPPPPPPVPPAAPYRLRPGKLKNDVVIQEFVEVETRLAVLQHRVWILEGENAALKNYINTSLTDIYQRIQTNEQNIEQRISELTLLRVPSPKAEGDVSEESESEDSDDEVEVVDQSAAAAKHPKILNLTNQIFTMFLGVPKLGKEDLPAMPEPYDESALPNVHGSKEQRQIRLDWKKNSKDTHNHAALRTMSIFAKTQGVFYVSGVKELLDVITQSDLDARFDTKYAALQKVYRGTSGKQSTKRAAAPGEALSTTKKNNRAKGKLEVRERKRLALPEDSEWRNSKYDTAFTIQQMSDDEDTFDANGTLAPQTYTSRAPTSRSEIAAILVSNQMPRTGLHAAEGLHFVVELER
ncbi:hypothetical protein EV421DRAFT_1741281 [Armillaria borealis]|uniref:Uncharacterized protein n=1 Tax=Armillaria borealis TaxID=47425 RepID=A0AA39J0H8_9AGAR|nr:hypothetical protein EV421DRAFT_1741281 [Armillaria borealis]